MANRDERAAGGFGLRTLGLTMGLLCLLGHPARALTGSDFLPLELGNFWIYDQAGTSITFTATGVSNVGGTDIFDITQSGGAESGAIENLSSDSNGVKVYGGRGPSPQGMLIFDFTPPVVDLPPTFEIGDQFGSSGSAFVQVVGVGSQTVAYTTSVDVLRVDPVTVPFGTFVDAILVQSTINLGGQVTTSQDWLVEGLGPIKEVVTGPMGFTRELTMTNVPEPDALLLLGGGLAALALARPRR